MEVFLTTRPVATDTPLLLPTFTPTPAPSLSTDPYAGLTIESLINRDYGGGEVNIIDTLERKNGFTRYLFTYPSDGIEVTGFMNVPDEGNIFPVALVLHGYISPAVYETLAYTTRYADALAEAGYMVFHPNFRNYPPSESGPNPFRIGYAIDVLNLITIIREQSQDPLGYLRRANGDDINLWGHSMGGGVLLRVITVNNEEYIRAAVLYGSMSGDERLNFNKIYQWSNGSDGDFELAASDKVIRAVSPIYHLDRINTPIEIHHGGADDVVPPSWSDDLCQRLRLLNHPVECFSYTGQPHTFRGQGEELFMQRVVDFFNRH